MCTIDLVTTCLRASVEANDSFAVVSVAFNPKKTTAFVLFGNEETLRKAWVAGKKHKIVMASRVIKVRASDETVEQRLEASACVVRGPAYEDPNMPFLQLLLDEGISEIPYFPLIARKDDALRAGDHIGFANAWKSLLFEECRAQLRDGVERAAASMVVDKARWYSVVSGSLAIERDPTRRDARIHVRVQYGDDQDELLHHDALLVVLDAKTTLFCVVESLKDRSQLQLQVSQKSDLSALLKQSPPPSQDPLARGNDIRLFFCASLATAKRCYEALNWYHTRRRDGGGGASQHQGDPVWDSLFKGTAPTFLSMERPRAPAGLNESQGKMISSFAVLKEGAMLCVGPPGCGKTTATVAAISIASSPGMRVLVCAPSNKAVQEILERFRAQYPLFPVLFLGNKRRPLPPLVCDVYADDFFELRASRLLKAAEAESVQAVEDICRDLERYGLLLHGGASAVKVVLRQCTRAKQLDCWSCGRSRPCHQACPPLKEWGKESKALGELHALLLGPPPAMRDALLLNSRILFCTLATAGRRGLRNVVSQVDTLIVDEAAQASEPELLIALYFSPRSCLLIGDPKQLPATVFSEQAAALGYGVSTMERMMGMYYPYVLLDEQYRMCASIRQWPSQQFYQGLLRDAPSVAQRPVPWTATWSASNPFGSQASVPSGNRCFIDTACLASHERQRGTSWTNAEEARVVVALIKCMQAAAGSSFDAPKSVGVITMYLAQQEVIVQALARAALQGVRVSTVDGFQGGEMDVMIVTFVRSVVTPFLSNPKRINVALTRARFYCAVLGNAHAFLSDPLLSYMLRSYGASEIVGPDSFLLRVGEGADNAAGGAPSLPVEPASTKRETWACSKCKFDNFIHRTHCRRCNQAKIANLDTLTSSIEALKLETVPVESRKRETWACSKCKCDNFMQRTHCRRCNQANDIVDDVETLASSIEGLKIAPASQIVFLSDAVVKTSSTNSSWSVALEAQLPGPEVWALIPRGTNRTVVLLCLLGVLKVVSPASFSASHLDQRQIKAEAQFFHKYRKLIRWFSRDPSCVTQVATDEHIPLALTNRLKQYLTAYSTTPRTSH